MMRFEESNESKTNGHAHTGLICLVLADYFRRHRSLFLSYGTHVSSRRCDTQRPGGRAALFNGTAGGRRREERSRRDAMKWGQNGQAARNGGGKPASFLIAPTQFKEPPRSTKKADLLQRAGISSP